MLYDLPVLQYSTDFEDALCDKEIRRDEYAGMP